MNDLGFFLAVVASTFVVVDPVGTLPFFVGLTSEFSPEDRERILRRAVLIMAGILVAFTLVGRFLFTAYGFGFPAFEIAGGILLFIIAYDMLRGEIGPTKLTHADREDAAHARDEVAVFPIAIPLLAGPGAISTVMIYESSASSDALGISATFIAIVIVGIATYVIFRYGQIILRGLGRVGVMAMTRIFGLLLAAVAVQFVLNGAIAIIPQL
ncbi:Multiple antibiotic resistance (MarC)-related protein [mine drainage metagenome]|uniref:Multiple antibiotic resistance (MarC)-related protein n=1 Tax=mine drainage metagenome TaxID=410659 RepID=T0YPM0_9ZZZZ